MKIQLTILSLLLVILTILGYNYYLDNKIPAYQPPKTIVPKVVKAIPYYIELNFDEINKTITFENIPLKDIRVISGEKSVSVNRRSYPEEFTIDIINLKGDYNLKYKDTIIIVNNKNVVINYKVMTHNSVVIDNNNNFEWGSSVNYWEIPVARVEEYVKNGKLTYP